MPVLALGCGPSSGTDTDGGSEGTDDASTSASTEPTATGPSSTTTTTTGDTSSTTGLDDSTGPPDTTTDPGSCGVPPYRSCDPLAPEEECGGDQECTFDYHPKGGSWACGCDHGELGPYEECSTTTEPGDDCAATQVCSASGPVGPLLCRPLCGSPLCSEASVCQGELCHEPCDPLALESCPGSLYCGTGLGGFLCLPSGTFLEPGGRGDTCNEAGSCDLGLLCRPGVEVLGCGSGKSCCTAVCDQAVMDSCEPGEACTLLFDDPWPGSETLGVCTEA